MADVKDKRSVVFVSHSSAGKTSVIDAILYKAGANTRHGSVDEGSSMCDYNEDEIERKITITSKLLHINHNNILTFLMDTPGTDRFAGTESRDHASHWPWDLRPSLAPTSGGRLQSHPALLAQTGCGPCPQFAG